MTGAPASHDPSRECLPERGLGNEERIGAYRLLSRFLATPPDTMDLRLAAGLTGDGSEIGRAVDTFAACARAVKPTEAEDQFFRLFIGLGGGELAPYASVYISGSMHDAPLVALRHDLRRIGAKRATDVKEPEDHAAIVLEVMVGLLENRFGATANEAGRFFRQHLEPWMARFFGDLRKVEGAPLYAALGEVGSAFIEEERERFAGVHRDNEHTA